MVLGKTFLLILVSEGFLLMQNLNVLIISAPLYAASNNIWFLEAEKSKYKIILV